MTVAKKLQTAGKAVKNTVKKAAKKIDKAVVEPVADLFASKGKGTKKAAKSKTTHAKKASK